jgi:hypothetical protein
MQMSNDEMSNADLTELPPAVGNHHFKSVDHNLFYQCVSFEFDAN